MGTATVFKINSFSSPQDSIKGNTQDIAKYFESDVINYRHAFHAIPELGWEENKTLALLESILDGIIKKSVYNFEISRKEGGIWVDLTLDPFLPRVLFRSDIDGLPITEETNLSFSSKHKGLMHACGHDCHIAMLLGAFKAIAGGYIQPVTNIRFVWQRAEEFANQRSGGEKIVEEGVCDGITNVYGLHISSVADAGIFFSRPSIFLANSALIKFTIACSGGHVMRPNMGTSSIDVMVDILHSLRGFEKLMFEPHEHLVFVPSIANAGIATNIRPNHAKMCFAFRNFLKREEKHRFITAVKDKIELITRGYQTAYLSDFQYFEGYPVLQNDPENYQFVKNHLTQSGFKTAVSNLIFAGEDFSYYLQKVPGSFWTLGARQGLAWDHHTSKFDPDESYLWQGVAFWLYLSQLQPRGLPTDYEPE